MLCIEDLVKTYGAKNLLFRIFGVGWVIHGFVNSFRLNTGMDSWENCQIEYDSHTGLVNVFPYASGDLSYAPNCRVDVKRLELGMDTGKIIPYLITIDGFERIY